MDSGELIIETEQREELKEPTAAEKESLKYQLDILKNEMGYIHETIARMDGTIQAIKNWTVLVWGGSVLFVLNDPALYDYLLFTAISPVFFWYMDGRWRHLQRRSTFRAIQIGRFLNDGRLADSFQAGRLIDFTVYDPVGARHYWSDDPEYHAHVSMKRALFFQTVVWFYAVLVFISIFMALIL